MTEEVNSVGKPHDLARAAIESWRGRCIDLFARGEKVIGQTLEAIRAAAKEPTTVKLRHLAGQRSEDISRQLRGLKFPAKQSNKLVEAVTGWRVFEAKRVFFAHATMTVTLDSKGKWFAVFDMTVYRSDQPQRERWVVSECEANEFANFLDASWKQLSAQLGQVRKQPDTA